MRPLDSLVRSVTLWVLFVALIWSANEMGEALVEHPDSRGFIIALYGFVIFWLTAAIVAQIVHLTRDNRQP